MAYRLSQLEVPLDDPFRNDALNRRPVVEFLAGLIERTEGPFVLTLDSSWGTGKTTLVRMLQAELMRQNYGCIYFNAWQVDYITDPLVALVSSIDSLKIEEPESEVSFKSHLKKVRNITSLVAKRAVVAGAKALTAGALDLEDEMEKIAEEFTGESVNDIVEAFQKESSLLERFRAELEAAIEQLPSGGKKPTLVFFVDEIDRCRPTFAIELLERIKHLFDVQNIHFVLSLDKQQLEASIAAVYGQGINAAEYLRRFIDLEYELPAMEPKQFVTSLFARFELDEIFKQRTHPDLRYDRSNIIDFFSTLAEAVPLSLRAQERCFTRLRVVMDQTPNDHYLEPLLVSLLIVLRSSEPVLFKRVSNGEASAKDVMTYLGSLKGGQRLVDGRLGLAIEANLIVADKNDDRKKATLNALKESANDEKKSEQIRTRSNELLGFIQHLSGAMRGDVRLSNVTRKIDIAAGLRD